MMALRCTEEGATYWITFDDGEASIHRKGTDPRTCDAESDLVASYIDHYTVTAVPEAEVPSYVGL